VAGVAAEPRAAIRKPGGPAYRLLELGRLGIYEPIITQEVVAEWVRNCRVGLGRGRSMSMFGEADLDAFCAALEPMLAMEFIAAVRIGRAESPLYPIRHEAGVNLIQVPQGLAHHTSHMLDDVTFGINDMGDFHVVEAALRHGCRYLCTANTRDFKDGLRVGEQLEVIAPVRLYRLLLE
jgi:hypothetical protein